MKKYLKTIEDIEALRNTDTKIYNSGSDGYFQFVNGVPCLFCDTSDVFYNATIDFNEVESKLYIEVPDKPDESWVGKLGWVSDTADNKTGCEVFKKYNIGDDYPYETELGTCWKYFTPLTPEEVEKFTGYKVVKEEK